MAVGLVIEHGHDEGADALTVLSFSAVDTPGPAPAAQVWRLLDVLALRRTLFNFGLRHYSPNLEEAVDILDQSMDNNSIFRSARFSAHQANLDPGQPIYCLIKMA
ncbi:hypothetical protein ACFOY2_28120 [Nonomuraea purpurea]|uniref:Uncharacterized protein n=1 Tax=Nonomuraea purpurea TaxID=1849276 RepID=A0ABV8GE76_9ACTN